MRYMIALLSLALLSSCLAALVGGATNGSSGGGDRRAAGPRVASAESGSKTAAAYDDATKLLETAEADTVTPEGPILPGHTRSAKVVYRVRALVMAERTAANMLAEVKRMKEGGEWVEGLQYTVVGKETLSEKEILRRLKEMRGRAKSEREELAPKLAAAYRREFPNASAAQLEALEQYGLPIEIQARKKGESCWKFETDEAWPTSCWKKNGALASQTEKPKPKPKPDVAERAAAEQGVAETLSAASVETATQYHAGDCTFNDCATAGWTTPDGDNTQCTFSKCLSAGWTTSHPDGRQSTTQCNFDKCWTDGWITRLADGRQVECTCDFNDCSKGYDCR